MPIWIEAALGLLAVALCAAACWREDKLIAWEGKLLRRMGKFIRGTDEKGG